jgi:hypothetical protein
MILTAPFQIEDLKKIVSGDIESLEIDIKESKIKNQSLLTYIYNLNLKNPKIHFAEATLQERRDFFVSYINHKTIVEVDSLNETYLRFLFNLKNITDIDEDAEEELLQKSIFTVDEVTLLMNTDQELRDLVERSAFLLDGIIVHLILSLNDVVLMADEEFQKVGVLDDKNWLGHTWVNLLKSPIFNVHYYSKMPELKELVYFPYYYVESIYKGQPLISFLSECPFVTSLMEISFDAVKETPQ